MVHWPFFQRIMNQFIYGTKGGTIVKRQGGQDIVEFALMIPLFMAFLVGIALFGLYFSDWVTYNNLARSMAREAAVATASIQKDDNQNEIVVRDPSFDRIAQEYVKYYKGVTTHIYLLTDDSIKFSIVDNDKKIVRDSDTTKQNPPYSVKVELHLSKNSDDTGFLLGVKNLRIIIPDSMDITYYMYAENDPRNQSTQS